MIIFVILSYVVVFVVWYRLFVIVWELERCWWFFLFLVCWVVVLGWMCLVDRLLWVSWVVVWLVCCWFWWYGIVGCLWNWCCCWYWCYWCRVWLLFDWWGLCELVWCFLGGWWCLRCIWLRLVSCLGCLLVCGYFWFCWVGFYSWICCFGWICWWLWLCLVRVGCCGYWWLLELV